MELINVFFRFKRTSTSRDIPIIHIYENRNTLANNATLENACVKVYQCYPPIQTDFNLVQEANQRHQTRKYIQ